MDDGGKWKGFVRSKEAMKRKVSIFGNSLEGIRVPATTKPFDFPPLFNASTNIGDGSGKSSKSGWKPKMRSRRVTDMGNNRRAPNTEAMIRSRELVTVELSTKRHSFHNLKIISEKQDLLSSLRAYYDPGGDKYDNGRNPLYSDASLLARESLKWDKNVRDILNMIWTVVDDDKSGAIEFEEYEQMNIKLYRVLVDDSDDKESEIRRRAIAVQDWDADSMGRGNLDKQRFTLAWFQLADQWTNGISAEEYCQFLRHIFIRVTKIEDGIIKFKDDKDIRTWDPAVRNESPSALLEIFNNKGRRKRGLNNISMITSLKKKDVCTSKRSQGKRQLRPFRGTHRHLKESSSSSSSSHQDRLQDSMTPLSASEIKMDKLLFSSSKTSDTCLNLSAGITENTNVQDKASNLSTKKKRLSGASGHILSKEKVINARSTCGKRKKKESQMGKLPPMQLAALSKEDAISSEIRSLCGTWFGSVRFTKYDPTDASHLGFMKMNFKQETKYQDNKIGVVRGSGTSNHLNQNVPFVILGTFDLVNRMIFLCIQPKDSLPLSAITKYVGFLSDEPPFVITGDTPYGTFRIEKKSITEWKTEYSRRRY